MVGEPTQYQAVWDDYKIGSLKLVQYQQPMERRLADIVFTHKVRLNTTIWRRAVAAPSPLSGCLLMDGSGSLKFKMARAVACRQIVVRYSRSTQP